MLSWESEETDADSWLHQPNGESDASRGEQPSQMAVRSKETTSGHTPLGTARLPQERQHVGITIKRLDSFPTTWFWLSVRVQLAQKVASSSLCGHEEPQGPVTSPGPCSTRTPHTSLQLSVHRMLSALLFFTTTGYAVRGPGLDGSSVWYEDNFALLPVLCFNKFRNT